MKLPGVVYFFTLVLMVCAASLMAWLASPFTLTTSHSIALPLPSFLTRVANAQVTSLNMWLPAITPTADPLALSAKSALSYDLTTNTILFAKDPNQRLPMASLTKIMTAIVSLENPKKNDAYMVVPADIVGEDSMGLSVGESLTLSDLLYGLILHSGNDAAETLASNYPGGRSAFIDAMNQKALALGLTNTHFTNPTGLEGDGTQYTTTADLLVMARYALSYPLFDTVAATFDYTIPQTPTHAVYYLENETNLLSSYPGVKGIKTGYTPEAGLCLVTYLTYGGHHIISVILGSDDRRGEMIDMLDYSLKKIGVTPPVHG